MKKLVILLTFVLALMLSSCSILDNVKSAERAAESAVESVIDESEVDSNGHFKKEKLFKINGNLLDTYYSLEYTFQADGNLVAHNASNTTEDATYTYKVIDNLIEVTKSSSVEYYDYYDDLICVPIELNVSGVRTYLGSLVGILDGVVASERSTKTVGYHFELNVKKDDVIAVFTGDKDTGKGYYSKIRYNGTIYSNSKGEYYLTYLNADQISGFDSTTVGHKIVEVTVSKKVYKAVLYVSE